MKEFIIAAEEAAQEDAGTPVEDQFVEFKLVDVETDEAGKEVRTERVMRAYPPTQGQLTFMLAGMGRGQTNDNRFASIVNVMLECFRNEDRDYFEARLLTQDKKRMLPPKYIEGVFEYLMEEWFGRPTQPPSDSA